jgi:hypothetical protein
VIPVADSDDSSCLRESSLSFYIAFEPQNLNLQVRPYLLGYHKDERVSEPNIEPKRLAISHLKIQIQTPQNEYLLLT